MRKLVLAALLLASMPVLAAPASTVQATDVPSPANLTALLKVVPGGTVTLPAGEYGNVSILSKTFNPPLTVDASAATFVNIRVADTTGLTVKGGTFHRAAGPASYLGSIYVSGSSNIRFVKPTLNLADGTSTGVTFRNSTNVTLDGARIDRARVAVSLLQVDGASIINNALIGFAIDGIDVANSQNFDVSYNACIGNLLTDSHHPDCIQTWSGAGLPQTANGKFRFNIAHGGMQGVSGFNHSEIGQTGFSNLWFEGNNVVNQYNSAVAISDCVNCTFRNNHAVTQPGSVNRSSVNVGTRNTSMTACGNTTEAYNGKKAIVDPECN